SMAGQNVTLTATVSGPAGVSGNVVFYDASAPIGTAPVSSGVARLTTNALASGGHAITARYLGSGAIPPSMSAAFAQYVRPSGAKTRVSSVSVAASPSPATIGATVTLTATVTGANHQAPTGQVLFLLNGSVFGQSDLAATGSITSAGAFDAAGLPHGTHLI